MSNNQVEADIKMDICCVRELSVENNNGSFIPSMNQEYNLQIQHSDCSKDESGRMIQSLRITLIISAKDPEDDMTDKFKIVLEGQFSADKEIDQDKFEELVKYNGSSVLLSIARAKIEEVSSLSYANGKITFPIVNMVKFFDSQEE